MSIACAMTKQENGMTAAFPAVNWRVGCVVAAFVIWCAASAIAQTPPAAPADTTALAKEQQNPISSMATIPWQMNFNSGGGLGDGTFFLLNLQPVMPFKVSDRWNMIVRTVVPFVSMPGPETTRYTGIGDIQEQIYLTPSKGGSFTWGAGPVVSMPTATTAAMQTGSWAAGPTFVALVMPGPWVVGAVVNNVWTFADAGSATKMNQFLFQPFVNFNFGKGWAISTVPVITANWDAESGQKWTIPVGAGIGRTLVFSGRPLTLAMHYYHNVVHPDAAAANQVRFMVVMLFPKR
jgi:hypothetical protein